MARRRSRRSDSMSVIGLALLALLILAGLGAGGYAFMRLKALRGQKTAAPVIEKKRPVEVIDYRSEKPLEVGVLYRANRPLRLMRGGNPAALTPTDIQDIRMMPKRMITTVPTGVFRVARVEQSPHDDTWWMLLQVNEESIEDDIGQRAVERWLDSTQLLGARIEVVERPPR